MAKNTANYARVLASLKVGVVTIMMMSSSLFPHLQVERGHCDDVDMTTVLPHLPLPSDYSLSEYSCLLQPYLKELATRY